MSLLNGFNERKENLQNKRKQLQKEINTDKERMDKLTQIIDDTVLNMTKYHDMKGDKK